MPLAFILVNCEIGSEDSVIQKLKQIQQVKEVAGTFGSYDVLAKIESSSTEELKNAITNDVRKIENVTGTLTLMGIENQGQS